jgi:hypothetical protein
MAWDLVKRSDVFTSDTVNKNKKFEKDFRLVKRLAIVWTRFYGGVKRSVREADYLAADREQLRHWSSLLERV